MGQSLTKIRVAGVPEHFNMPWHWAIEQGLFEAKGLEVSWTDFPGGTGAMNKALRNEETDIALVLTEGIVTDIANGNPSTIVQFYVKSPLLWGIHVPANSSIQSIDQLKKKPFAISRNGSGSHLMAIILAQDECWKASDLAFERVGNLEGAKQALKEGSAYGFLWEKFTTKPLVDDGSFRRIGVIPTPWPCFSIAVRNSFLAENEEAIDQLLQVINKVCAVWKNQAQLAERIAERYQLQVADVEEWLSLTEWHHEKTADENTLQHVVQRLKSAGIIEVEALTPFE